MLGSMDGVKAGRIVAEMWAGQATELGWSAGVKPCRNRHAVPRPPEETSDGLREQQVSLRRSSQQGRLLRQLKLFESLRFERAAGESCYLTMINCSSERVGLDLEIPRVGQFLVAISPRSGDHVRFDICRGRGRELTTAERKAGDCLDVDGDGGNRFRMSAAPVAPYTIDVELEIPTIGSVSIRFRHSRDRARLQIVADRRIRIVPTARLRG